MKKTTITPSFEIDIRNLLSPTTIIAVNQSINTLTAGEVLKVNAASNNTASSLLEFCKRRGHTLLKKIHQNDCITLFIVKS